MSKKFLLFLLSFMFLNSFHFAYAEVVINEIMYDLKDSDNNREWIEFYNNGDTDFVIKGGTSGTDSLRVYEKKSSGTEYNRTFTTSTNSIISPGEYIVVAQNEFEFKKDYPNYSEKILIVSAMDLTNTSQTLGLRFGSSGDIWSLITYNSSQGANEDGNSLQLINGLWKAAIPTPGKQNENINTPPSSNVENNSSSSSSVSAVSSSTQGLSEIKIKVEIPKTKTKIISKTVGFVNIPIEFTANTTGYSGERLIYGDYFWNFGDGGFKEMKVSDNQKLTHTYFYEGEYTVSLDYFTNPYYTTPESSDKIIVNVIPIEIVISKVGDREDFFVELTNNTNYDVNISNWILLEEEITKNNINELQTKSFIFPKNTILSAKKKMILSSKITNLFFIDNGNLKLLNMNNDIIFDFAFGKEKDLEILKTPKGINTISMTPFDIKEGEIQPPVVSENQDVYQMGLSTDNKFNNNLASNIISSSSSLHQNFRKDFLKNIKVNSYFMIFIILLLSSASAIYFIRNKKVQRNIADDFEILDE